jgi:hypothetical protein
MRYRRQLLGCGLAGALLAGCRAAPPYPTFDDTRARMIITARGEAGGGNILFDRDPGYVSPDAFAWRSDWPSSEGACSPGEVIEFREYFVDRYGSNQSDGADFHKYARTRRSSISFR